jgi:hypothetical protein
MRCTMQGYKLYGVKPTFIYLQKPNNMANKKEKPPIYEKPLTLRDIYSTVQGSAIYSTG